MSKYMCLCGAEYKTKEMCDLHLKMNEGHYIFTKGRRQRFWEWLLKTDWLRFMRFVGGYLLYATITHHFKINWTMWESALMGIGMGFYIE